MPPRTLAREVQSRLRVLGRTIPLLRPTRYWYPPSSEGQHKCERSEALVGGDSRRTARATTADYLLWRAKGAALSFATGRRAIPLGATALLLRSRSVYALVGQVVKLLGITKGEERRSGLP